MQTFSLHYSFPTLLNHAYGNFIGAIFMPETLYDKNYTKKVITYTKEKLC